MKPKKNWVWFVLVLSSAGNAQDIAIKALTVEFLRALQTAEESTSPHTVMPATSLINHLSAGDNTASFHDTTNPVIQQLFDRLYTISGSLYSQSETIAQRSYTQSLSRLNNGSYLIGKIFGTIEELYLSANYKKLCPILNVIIAELVRAKMANDTELQKKIIADLLKIQTSKSITKRLLAAFILLQAGYHEPSFIKWTMSMLLHYIDETYIAEGTNDEHYGWRPLCYACFLKIAEYIQLASTWHLLREYDKNEVIEGLNSAYSEYTKQEMLPGVSNAEIIAATEDPNFFSKPPYTAAPVMVRGLKHAMHFFPIEVTKYNPHSSSTLSTDPLLPDPLHLIDVYIQPTEPHYTNHGVCMSIFLRGILQL